MISKSSLREFFFQKRNALPSVQKEEYDILISQKLFSLDEYNLCSTFFTYCSLKSEVSTVAIIEQSLKKSKTVALPKSLPKGIMTFHCIKSLEELTYGKYGIKEPQQTAPVCIETDKAVCIVPALAFDRAGFRLGYGGGYYDRFLPNFHGVKIGLCYEEFLVDILPKDKYDISVDMIITERSIYRIHAQ